MARAPGSHWPPNTLLGRVDPAIVKELLQLGAERDYAVGDVILRQGDTGDHLVLLIDGMAKVSSVTKDGAESLLAVRVSGDIVGEMSALNGRPRTATVTACRPTRTRVIRKQRFQEIMGARTQVALAMLAMSAQRLQWANRRREDIAAYPVKERLARIIAELDAEHGTDIPQGRLICVELTNAELATLVGAHKDAVQKALAELRAAGLVRKRYRTLTLPDRAALRLAVGLADE